MSSVPGSTSRFHPRLWRRRLRHLRPLLIASVVAVALGFAGYLVFFSSWLAADRIEVEGGAAVSDGAIARAAAIDPSTPLVRVDLDGIDGRVSKIAAVADVSVHRSWPDTITITVHERQPVATINVGGVWWIFDGQGVLYRTTPRPDPALAVVRFRGEADSAALGDIASVVTALPTGIRSQTRRVKARSMDSIHLVLRGGREVVWGSADDSARKAAVLMLLMKRRAAVYDVSVPEQPATTAR